MNLQGRQFFTAFAIFLMNLFLANLDALQAPRNFISPRHVGARLQRLVQIEHSVNFSGAESSKTALFFVVYPDSVLLPKWMQIGDDQKFMSTARDLASLSGVFLSKDGLDGVRDTKVFFINCKKHDALMYSIEIDSDLLGGFLANKIDRVVSENGGVQNCKIFILSYGYTVSVTNYAAEVLRLLDVPVDVAIYADGMVQGAVSSNIKKNYDIIKNYGVRESLQPLMNLSLVSLHNKIRANELVESWVDVECSPAQFEALNFLNTLPGLINATERRKRTRLVTPAPQAVKIQKESAKQEQRSAPVSVGIVPIVEVKKYQTFSKFHKTIEELVQRGTLPLTPVSEKDEIVRSSLVSAVEADEFMSVLTEARAIFQSAAVIPGTYLKKIIHDSQGFQATTNNKYVFLIFGDLHGQCLDLLKNLRPMIDDNFKLIYKNSSLIFLGDYADRYSMGVEVWYTLCRLIIANGIDRVIVLRGNHENAVGIAEGQGLLNFETELFDKFKEKGGGLWSLVSDLFDYLPLSLYIGARWQSEFIQFSHAGFEQHHSPINFLNMATIMNEYIDIEKIHAGKYSGSKEVVPSKDHWHLNGYTWSDFDVNETSGEFLPSSRGLGQYSFSAGPNAIRKYFTLQTNGMVRLLIRGHDHLKLGNVDGYAVGSINKVRDFHAYPVFTVISMQKETSQGATVSPYLILEASSADIDDWLLFSK